MEIQLEPATLKPEKKTADKRKYMREYKQKVYAENPAKIKESNHTHSGLHIG